MGEQAKFKPRKAWPDWIIDPLKRAGISQHETVETLLPKIEELGLKVVDMYEDKGGLLSTYSLYYAAVTEANIEGAIIGQYWSETDYAEALSWATGRALGEREGREGRTNE